MKKYWNGICLLWFMFIVYLCLSCQRIEAHFSHDKDTIRWEWSPASGVAAGDHYNVEIDVSTDDGVSFPVKIEGNDVPVQIGVKPSYTFTGAQDGHTYRIRAQAEAASGITGPFSDFSDPVTVDFPNYTVTIHPGINVISLPLDPKTPQTLENLLALVEADFMFYYDNNDFQYYEGGPTSVLVEGGVAYIIVRNASTSVDVTFEGVSWANTVQPETFVMTIRPGINMIGVPLNPGKSWTVWDLLKRLPIDFLFHYDGTDFQYYGRNSGKDVVIRGGEGYIAVRTADDAAQFRFEGMPWENASASAAPSAISMTRPLQTSILAVVGSVLHPPDGGTVEGVSLRLHHPQSQRTISTQPSKDGSYRFVFFDPMEASPIEVGDRVEITVADNRGRYEHETFVVDINVADIQNHRLTVPSIVLALLPKETKLFANYPDPLNPDTWIPFQLAHDSNVTIEIYDTSGERVRSLELGSLPAGRYIDRHKAAYWDGKNQSGEHVASGVYFYTFRTDDFVATQKLVVLK